jgi:hypothetical protein
LFTVNRRFCDQNLPVAGSKPVPRVGFIVTNLTRPAERVVAFYNQRGTCEQWIKESNAGARGPTT